LIQIVFIRNSNIKRVYAQPLQRLYETWGKKQFFSNLQKEQIFKAKAIENISSELVLLQATDSLYRQASNRVSKLHQRRNFGLNDHV